MKLIKTLENKPSAPVTLIAMLIGGQVLLTPPQGCLCGASIANKCSMSMVGYE